MKFPESWLREWVDPEVDSAALVHQLTMAGLEVDDSYSLADGLGDVVVARITSCQPHPDADRLQVCTVDNGDEALEIVCGAPNARNGLMTALAPVGATLPGGMKIKRAKLRGVESWGMLCSPRELGLSDDADGILELPDGFEPGASLVQALELNDTIIDVDLTPDRADCLSIEGLAREVSAINGSVLEAPPVPRVSSHIDDTIAVELADPQACPRYLGRVVRGVDVQATTPHWMVQKLRRAGLRSISPVVDVTNFVMLELGQPLHAFESNRLDGPIKVRLSRAGEQLTLLDSRTITLEAGTLLICDGDRPVALAGIMGGEDTEVTTETRDIFLESAWFAPEAILGKARALGLHTDASHRFERGVSLAAQEKALERATGLLMEITGGQPGPIERALVREHLPQRQPITLRHRRVEKVLGIDLEPEAVADILARLGMGVSITGTDQETQWSIEPPQARFDLSIEEDLIEEVARLHGYDNIPARMPSGRLAATPETERSVPMSAIRGALVERGYQEVMTYSFTSAEAQKPFAGGHPCVPLANPLTTDLAVMRGSLLPGLLNALSFNRNRQQERVRLFETGAVFLPRLDDSTGSNQEPHHLAMVASGPARTEQWSGQGRAMDFFDLKGDLQALLGLGSGTVEFACIDETDDAWQWLHPGRGARLTLDDELLGYAGQLHPGVSDTNEPIWVAELKLDALRERALPWAAEIPRFPSIRRDLALIIHDNVRFADVRRCVTDAAGKQLERCFVFDIFRGENLPEDHQSMAIGLIFREISRTLEDKEVDTLVARIVDQLKQQLGATIRG